jgi:hypothetical protein
MQEIPTDGTVAELRAILEGTRSGEDKADLMDRFCAVALVGGEEEASVLRRLSLVRGWAGLVKDATAKAKKQAEMDAPPVNPLFVERPVAAPSGLSTNEDGALEVRCGHDGAETLQAAWQVMQATGKQTPPIYRQPGRVVRVVDGQPLDVSSDALRGMLAERADWYVWKAKEEAWKKIPLPPSEYPAIMTSNAMASASDIPVLESILSVPYVSRSGAIVKAPGYYSEDCTLLVPHGMKVKRMELGKAKDFLLDWIDDFPFATVGGKAHAIGLALTPLVRRMIAGPVPPVLIEAPKPRTGKTLLAQVLAAPSSGWPSVRPFPDREEEQEKAMLSALLKARPVLVLDNLKGRINSAVLEAALTAYPTWGGRVLGKSEDVEIVVRSQWILTSNNGEFSEDMVGRLVVIRLDRHSERPDLLDVSTLKHPDIKKWMEENKDELLSALLTLVQAWIDAGRPGPAEGTPGKGSFEAWREVIGGILNVAGIAGFLKDASASRAESDEWRGFVTLWAKKCGEGKMRLKELLEICNSFEVLRDVLGAGNEQTQLIRLGKAINSRRDQVFDINDQAILDALKADDEPPLVALERCRYCGDPDGGLLVGGWRIKGQIRVMGTMFYSLVRQ